MPDTSRASGLLKNVVHVICCMHGIQNTRPVAGHFISKLQCPSSCMPARVAHKRFDDQQAIWTPPQHSDSRITSFRSFMSKSESPGVTDCLAGTVLCTTCEANMMCMAGFGGGTAGPGHHRRGCAEPAATRDCSEAAGTQLPGTFDPAAALLPSGLVLLA